MTPATTRMTADERRDADRHGRHDRVLRDRLLRHLDRGHRPPRPASASRTSSSCSGRRRSCSWPRSATASGGPGCTSRRPAGAPGPRTRRPSTSSTRWVRPTASSSRDRELLRCQLQAYAACDDPEIRAVVGEEFMRIYAPSPSCPAPTTRRSSTGSPKGMLMNTAAAIGPEMAETGVVQLRRAREDRRDVMTTRATRPLFSPRELSDY